MLLDILFILIGFALLVKGGDFLISGAVAIAQRAKLSPMVIGLTVIGFGTSLPELFASVIAARKGETDMAVGNIVGSVSFNILCVIGISSAITPIQNAWTPFVFDYLVMFALGLILLLFLRTKHLLERWEGALLLLAYILYIARTLYI